ncbi:S8 family serine peptidase [Pseudonocardia alaniniphila]|uniref:S8 family serine peptidase n=1 Tax=Pseudonocardia alaniniphila TaxID=75291 RepID=A0ABS9TLM5_9PSEU|nr:S8 family serine peptidase [Pseudonocardia alaniniphila]MCH6169436.1 S8 family serine peptidase [Pseudonocardia alaniniphila]
MTGPDAQPAASTTGRYLLVISDELFGDDEASREVVREVSGVEDVVSTKDPGAQALDPAATTGALLFAELGVAVVSVAPDRVGATGVFESADDRILAVEQERVVHALQEAAPVDPEQEAAFTDDTVATWGLHATGVLDAAESGAGITIAVLDTGIDLRHPDFAGRDITTRSFVDGETAQDVQGHGTHCAGTMAGPREPAQGRRYGIAYGARLLVGKVLNNQGSGTDADILAGMSWAISAGAQVISMSLGADQRAISTAYETVGRRALAAGTLIVAAAGNNARRSQGNPGFVGVPANSPSILAVAAVDSTLAVADFSASATDVGGGEIDIAAPGVAVYSSWPLPRRTNTISGTSMATPHVAGIAALWAERSGARGRGLWDEVVGAARALDAPVRDVGAGLVQAPS